MKKLILLMIISFSFNVKAESIDFNSLIIEVEASIAQHVKTVVTSQTQSKLRQPASDQSETKQVKQADSQSTNRQ